MGCDIHTYTEVKKDGKWVMVSPYFTPECIGGHVYEARGAFDARNYRLFGILAGVRSGGPCMTKEPRGFPADASDSVKFEYEHWGPDAHTPSYVTLAELVAYRWDRSYVGDLVLTHVDDLKEWVTNGKFDYDDVRVVFWFDN